jgi:histone H3/H4
MAQQRNTHIIPRATAARILMKAGARRVSAPAVNEFSELIQKIAEEIGEQAVKIAKHSGRKTVHEKDIKLAAK